MKSLEHRFSQTSISNPSLSSYICFSIAIKKQGFSKATILKWFNKLVDKDDYARENKGVLVNDLVLRSIR